jgi:hypothetical protein
MALAVRRKRCLLPVNVVKSNQKPIIMQKGSDAGGKQGQQPVKTCEKKTASKRPSRPLQLIYERVGRGEKHESFSRLATAAAQQLQFALTTKWDVIARTARAAGKASWR